MTQFGSIPIGEIQAALDARRAQIMAQAAREQAEADRKRQTAAGMGMYAGMAQAAANQRRTDEIKGRLERAMFELFRVPNRDQLTAQGYIGTESDSQGSAVLKWDVVLRANLALKEEALQQRMRPTSLKVTYIPNKKEDKKKT